MNDKYKAWLPVFLGITLAIGVYLGNLMAQKEDAVTVDGNIFNSFFDKKSKLQSALDLIDSDYVEDVDVDSITEDIMPQILAKLDPHSVYIPAKDLELANEGLEGSFSGIGVQFNIKNDTVMVIAVINGGPSEKMGILAGDRIVMVDDSLFVGDSITNERVIKRLRGEKGTKVELGIKRRSSKELLTYVITRGDVPLKSVDVAYMLTPKVGYVKVSSFGENTYNEFITSLAKLNNLGAKKFVIDLRGNSGGYLSAAIDLINEFLVKGSMIVYTEGKSYPRKDALANGKGLFQKNELVVLTDEWSASASEIFAGAIQDNDRGLIIGRRSYGKGLVQQQIKFDDGSAIRLTVARYFTPSGRCIQKPYEKGHSDNYEMDILNRYLHGELSSKDSIQFSDSLKYETLHMKRTVYGGGGIMPDVFIPKDTILYTKYYDKVSNKGLINEYAFVYVDKNRERLNQLKDWKEIVEYLNDKTVFDDFIQFASDKGVKRNRRQIRTSRELLQRNLFALIARDVLGDAAFYPIINKNDACVKEAVKQLSNKHLVK